MFKWNSKEYLRFEKERTQPAKDLLSRIDCETVESIYDIGCGPGNSTQILKDRYPRADVIGLDSSENMIKTAREQHRNCKFDICDAGKDLSKFSKKVDICFSNACIQWIENHEVLIPEMYSLLKKNGVLAIQVPANHEEPIQQIIVNISKREEWKDKIGNLKTFYYYEPSLYYDIFKSLKADFEIWKTTYFHSLPSHEAIMDWYKGTGLRPYLSELNGEDKQKFEEEVFSEVKKSYPLQKDGSVIFAFPRLFMIAKNI